VWRGCGGGGGPGGGTGKGGSSDRGMPWRGSIPDDRSGDSENPNFGSFFMRDFGFLLGRYL
jgi:hypothetical protein